MDYKKLSASEKIEQVRQYRPYEEERQYMAVYLTALRRNDRQTIDEYESFGDDPRHIIMNHRAYDRGQLFGFTAKTLNEHDWLENAEFMNVERIEFIDRKGWAAFNYVTIGQGANGKWSYGASYSTGGSGGGYRLGIWGKVYTNRTECLIAALRELLSRHAQQRERLENDPANFNPTLSNTGCKAGANHVTKNDLSQAVNPIIQLIKRCRVTRKEKEPEFEKRKHSLNFVY